MSVVAPQKLKNPQLWQDEQEHEVLGRKRLPGGRGEGLLAGLCEQARPGDWAGARDPYGNESVWDFCFNQMLSV